MRTSSVRSVALSQTCRSSLKPNDGESIVPTADSAGFVEILFGGVELPSFSPLDPSARSADWEGRQRAKGDNFVTQSLISDACAKDRRAYVPCSAVRSPQLATHLNSLQFSLRSTKNSSCLISNGFNSCVGVCKSMKCNCAQSTWRKGRMLDRYDLRTLVVRVVSVACWVGLSWESCELVVDIFRYSLDSW